MRTKSEYGLLLCLSPMHINQKGSAIIMVLIVATVAAVSALALMTLISSSEKYNVTRRKEEDLMEIISSFRMRMNDSVDCSLMLAGTPPSLANSYTAPGAETNLFIYSSFGADTNSVLQAGTTFKNGLSLKKITIQSTGLVASDKRFAYSSTPVAPNAAAATTKYSAVIRFYTDSIPWKADLAEKKINIFIKVRNSTGKIWECHGYDSPAESCEVVTGGTYNPKMPVSLEGYRCNPDKNCFATRIGSPDGLYPTAVCPNPPGYTLYKAQYLGNMNGQNKYICNWCNPYRP